MTNQFSKMPRNIDLDVENAIISYTRCMTTKDIEHEKTGKTYLMLNCDKNVSCFDDHIPRMYNAVLLDPTTRTILSIASPISYDLTGFNNLYPNNEQTNDIVIEEMVEGVSIQLFYDFRNKKWELSTRNSVYGDYSYYRLPTDVSKTYREMFFDAIEVTDNTIESWEEIQYMDQKTCYHFILQHPQNHLVFNKISPRLYYVGCYRLHLGGKRNSVSYHSCHELSVFPSDKVNLPRTFSYDSPFSYEEKTKELLSIHDDVYPMGIGFLSLSTGNRYFVVHPKYKELQELRGIHPNILYQYLCLRKISKITEFVTHFPQYKQMYWKFNELYENLVKAIHQGYHDYYVGKTEKRVNKSIFFHMAQIHHNIYKPSLQDGKKIIVRRKTVRDYVNTLEPGCILHLLQNEKYKQDQII